MKKIEDSFMAKLLYDTCVKLGHKLIMGPKMGAYGQIENKSSHKRISFYNCCFDINEYGSSLITRNKGLTRLILEPKKILLPKGKYFSFDSDEYSKNNVNNLLRDVKEFIQELNFPIIVKGADLHRGSCVFKVNSEEECLIAIKNSFKKTNGVVIEEFIDFPTYRVLIFDGNIVACYRQDPFHIIGDGKSTAFQLIKKTKKIIRESPLGADFRGMNTEILEQLNQEGYAKGSIIPKDKKVILTATASIPKGGQAVDCINYMNDQLKEYCKKICTLLNLRLCGIDFVSKNISKAPSESYLLEANSSPRLESYSLIGDKQSKVIENLMEEIIEKSFKKLGKK